MMVSFNFFMDILNAYSLSLKLPFVLKFRKKKNIYITTLKNISYISDIFLIVLTYSLTL